jgi:hypothetical protein
VLSPPDPELPLLDFFEDEEAGFGFFGLADEGIRVGAVFEVLPAGAAAGLLDGVLVVLETTSVP